MIDGLTSTEIADNNIFNCVGEYLSGMKVLELVDHYFENGPSLKSRNEFQMQNAMTYTHMTAARKGNTKLGITCSASELFNKSTERIETEKELCTFELNLSAFSHSPTNLISNFFFQGKGIEQNRCWLTRTSVKALSTCLRRHSTVPNTLAVVKLIAHEKT